jgi:phosphate-selective porin OprO/OprP
MAHASILQDRINYGIGFFTGDGLDDSTGGDVDSPEFTGRIVFAPFRDGRVPVLNDFQFGGSFSKADIDRNNVDIHLSTTGLTSFFDVASRAKFRIIREAEDLRRIGTEVAWACGPFALMGEWIRVDFGDVETSADQFDIELKDYYIAFLLNLTGEEPVFKNGILQPIKPSKGILDGGWGGVGLAFRYDHFEADESVYEYLIEKGDSIREAKGYSFALNWYLDAYARLVFDFTRTDFDTPLLIYRDPLTGEAVYSDREDVLTGRFQFQF